VLRLLHKQRLRLRRGRRFTALGHDLHFQGVLGEEEHVADVLLRGRGAQVQGPDLLLPGGLLQGLAAEAQPGQLLEDRGQIGPGPALGLAQADAQAVEGPVPGLGRGLLHLSRGGLGRGGRNLWRGFGSGFGSGLRGRFRSRFRDRFRGRFRRGLGLLGNPGQALQDLLAGLGVHLSAVGVEHLLDVVPGPEHEVEQVRAHGQLLVADHVEDRLHLVGEGRHAVEPEHRA